MGAPLLAVALAVCSAAGGGASHSWGRHGFDGAASASCASRARCAPDTTQRQPNEGQQHAVRQRQRAVRSPGRSLTAATIAAASGPASGDRYSWAGGGGSPQGAPNSDHAAGLADKLVDHDVRSAPDASSILAGSTTQATIALRVGPMVVFGAGAPAGAAPFAQLATVTPLASGARPWLLLTATEVTAAPGAEFSIAKAETWRALDFSLGLAVPLRRSWVPLLIVSAGAQALAYRDDATGAPTVRRAGVGLRVSSGPASRLDVLASYDERAGGWAVLITAGVDLGSDLGLVGSALVGRNATMRLAAVRRWGGR